MDNLEYRSGTDIRIINCPQRVQDASRFAALALGSELLRLGGRAASGGWPPSLTLAGLFGYLAPLWAVGKFQALVIAYILPSSIRAVCNDWRALAISRRISTRLS